jgi:hypothetical protein
MENIDEKEVAAGIEESRNGDGLRFSGFEAELERIVRGGLGWRRFSLRASLHS